MPRPVAGPVLPALVSLLCVACDGDVAGVEAAPPVLPDLIGEWEWICSTGGFLNETICASTSGQSQTWSFGADGVFEWHRGDTLILRASFDVRREVSGASGDSINLLYLDRQPGFALEMPDYSSLWAHQQCGDCYTMSWARIP